MIPRLDRKWSRGKTRNVMEFDSCIFFALKFIHFYKLNDEWNKQEIIFWRRELWCDKLILLSLDNSSEKLLEKIKARKQQYHFPTSSIYNNRSLMLPKLSHKIFRRFYLDAIFMLNNLISNPHHYTAPKVRETNTKANANTNSNSIRGMFMTF